MIQTVEQAAELFDAERLGPPTPNMKVTLTEEEASTFIKEAFIAGASWQREEGIEWISVKDSFPVVDYSSNEGKDKYSQKLLLTDGSNVHIGKAHYFKGSPIPNYIGIPTMVVTHYAYLTLPKIDNNGQQK